jgi:hypothetical protein
VHISEKVLERLATSDMTTIVIERQPDGKMRVASGSWDGEKVFFEGSGAQGAARDRRRPAPRRSQNQGAGRLDPPYGSYDPYGPGGVASDEFIDD